MKVVPIFLIFALIILTKTVTSAETLDNKILKIEKEVADIYGDISANNLQIEIIKKNIEDTNTIIGNKKKYLSKRILAQKNLKNYSWFLSLGAANKAILDRNLKIFKNINSSDLTEIAELKWYIDEKSNQSSDLKKENSKLLTLITKLKDKENSLKEQESLWLDRIKQERDVDHLLNFKGTLDLPVKGKIVQTFGDYNDKNNQFALLVKGLVIEPPPQSTVRAFGPGKVIFSDQIPYWGQSLIVAHKGGYFTVYAGLLTAQVGLNDEVSSQQIIAEATGKDFYFELRHQQIPINPMKWIK